jgi:hypothetical protein
MLRYGGRFIYLTMLLALTTCSEPAADGGDAKVDAAAPPVDAGELSDASETPDAEQPSEVPANGEVCDGIDNDGNGTSDDADVEGDGVCDCLKIASVGRAGDSSNGTFAFRDWPNARAQNHVVALNDQILTDELLAPFDVLIILNVATVPVMLNDKSTPRAAFSNAEVASFERWVRAGGGAITTIGYCDDEAQEVTNVNRLLAPFGLGYSSTKLYLDGMVEKWVPHPVTAGVQKILTVNGIDPDGPKGLTLATDLHGYVALQASKSDSERLLVWGDEWITYASEWQAKADQQVERFWLNSLTWLSGTHKCQAAIAAAMTPTGD